MSKVMDEKVVSCTLLAQEVGVKEKSGEYSNSDTIAAASR